MRITGGAREMKIGKRRIYEQFGVREYIIAFPERGYLERYSLDGDYRGPDIFKGDERLQLVSLEIEIDLRQIFGEENPDESGAVPLPLSIGESAERSPGTRWAGKGR